MILDATTKSIQVKLGEAISSSNLDVTASYADITSSAFTPIEADTVTNGTTAVTVVAAPASSTQRDVKEIRIHNNDTITHTIILQYNDNSTIRIMMQQSIVAGGDFLYTPTTTSQQALWNAGTVTAIGTGLALASGTLTPQWQEGTVTALGTGLALSSGTLTPQWQGGTVSALGTGVAINSGTLTPQWQGGTVTSVSNGLTIASNVIEVNAGQVPGTATNNNASAGNVGEYVSSSVALGSAVALTTSTAVNVTSISLTAGDWDVEGLVCFTSATSTSFVLLQGWISTTSATTPTEPNSGAEVLLYYPTAIVPGGGVFSVQPVGCVRLSLSATTTVYLSARAAFSVSTASGYGFIGARRQR